MSRRSAGTAYRKPTTAPREMMRRPARAEPSGAVSERPPMTPHRENTSPHPLYWSWAQRLLLAYLTGYPDSAGFVADEIGDCARCWEIVALYAARLAADGWFHAGDNDAIVDSLCNGIAHSLDQLERYEDSQ